MAIRFRGALQDFSQLDYGYCPAEATRLKEGDTLNNVIVQAMRQSVPLFLLVGALSVVRLFKGLDWSQDFSIWQVFFVMVLWSALYFVLIVVHEWLHALFFPRRATKDIWLYQLQAAMVYCNTPVSRTRFIVMSLAPAVLLGFLPFVAWLLWAAVPNPVISLAWMSMSWSMIFGGVGDFYNVRNVLEQVPKDALVFNYGIHTYWLHDPRKQQ